MADLRTARRRWFGAFYLTAATALLMWGQTVFKPYLHGLGFLFYWSVCFLLTLMAIVTALADVVILRRQTRKEKRDLLERTLGPFTDPSPDEEQRRPEK
jgi:hypothetical protein